MVPDQLDINQGWIDAPDVAQARPTELLEGVFVAENGHAENALAKPGDPIGITENIATGSHTDTAANNTFMHVPINAETISVIAGSASFPNSDGDAVMLQPGASVQTKEVFHRPVDIEVDMYQTQGSSECGVVQLFPQTGQRHTGYNAGVGWWGNQYDHSLGACK